MISVFIVEDDLSLQRLYEMMLKTLGFEVMGKVNNGKDALDKLEMCTKKPDVILMDHRMPIKNGIDTTMELLKYNSHAKIIFTSADNSVRGKALSIGACAFIEKPFSVEQLHNVIKKVMEVS